MDTATSKVDPFWSRPPGQTPRLSNLLYMEVSSAPDMKGYLDNLRMKYARNLFIVHLTIDSIGHKFYKIYDMLNGNRTDVCGISETNINACFTNLSLICQALNWIDKAHIVKEANRGVLLCTLKDSIPQIRKNFIQSRTCKTVGSTWPVLKIFNDDLKTSKSTVLFKIGYKSLNKFSTGVWDWSQAIRHCPFPFGWSTFI